jgi:hypothetical protein
MDDGVRHACHEADNGQRLMAARFPPHATPAASTILASVLAEPDRVHRYDGRQRRPIEALAAAGLVTVSRQIETVRGSRDYAVRVHYLVRAMHVTSESRSSGTDASA